MQTQKKEDLETKLQPCFYQTFRPDTPTNINGWGDCTKCVYDPTQNEKCAGYTPFKYTLMIYITNKK